MIFLFHQHNKVIEIRHGDHSLPITYAYPIARQLFMLAEAYPNELIIWCEENQKSKLNTRQLPNLFYHQKMIHSYGSDSYLGDSIGFVEDSPFIEINPQVPYPTWQLNSVVGGVHAAVLNAVSKEMPRDLNFDYFLNSLGKLVMPLGVFCYNNPNLLMEIPKGNSKRGTSLHLFRFVKQHYKTRWVFLLFLNLVYYKKQFPLLPFINALFYSERKLTSNLLDKMTLDSSKNQEAHFELDVVIPTIGRKEYVQDVLKDLAKQILLPKKVILVEQNPEMGSSSELDYLTSEPWPFQVKHLFIHKTGACNARNLALREVTADAVFLADDDIRMESAFLKQACQQMISLQAEACTFSCLQENEKETLQNPIQWKSFGSGCSIVYTKVLKEVNFDTGFEHGFGEDADFGMQLRKKGVDVIYLPNPRLKHLKAPVGGFRLKPVQAWGHEIIKPKPAPTMMLFYSKHRTKEQLLGYKTTLSFKYYKKQSIKNPFTYFRTFKKQWQKSVFWANQLLGTKH